MDVSFIGIDVYCIALAIAREVSDHTERKPKIILKPILVDSTVDSFHH